LSVGAIAGSVLAQLQLEEGISVVSVSIDPDKFNFGEVISLA
jgi:hypothetical protein